MTIPSKSRKFPAGNTWPIAPRGTDEAVGLTPKRLTPAAEELTTLAGTTGEGFQEAAEKLLPKLASMRLSESTVQRTSETAGRRLRGLLQKHKVLGGPTSWTWHKDARGKTCAYVSIDATGVRQQGPGGKAAEGRMPYVAMVFNPVPDLPVGHPLKHGTELELILDFWHAADSLLKLAKTIHPSDEERRKQGYWHRQSLLALARRANHALLMLPRAITLYHQGTIARSQSLRREVPMSLVSVLMPMRNAEPFVRIALESVLAQSGVDLEVVVIDDGSKDRSAAIVRELNDARVRLLPGPCKGFVAAMNAALEAARGDIVAECDADDLYPAERLAWQVQWLADHADFGAVCGSFATLDNSGRPVADFECGGAAAELTQELLAGTTRTHLCSFAVRTKWWRQLGGMRSYFVTGSDIDLQLRLAEVCRVWFEPKKSYLWRLHDLSLTHTQGSAQRMFFEERAREFARQRRAGQPDDIDRGCPPPPPADLAHTASTSAAQIQGILLGQAWQQHKAGHKLAALRIGFRACWAKPLAGSAWKSLAALALKPTP